MSEACQAIELYCLKFKDLDKEDRTERNIFLYSRYPFHNKMCCIVHPIVKFIPSN